MLSRGDQSQAGRFYNKTDNELAYIPAGWGKDGALSD